MAINPDVLDALLAAGATAEMIVAAVKADLAVEAEKAENRRRKERERQRRHRERTALSRDVTVTNVTSRDVTPCHGDPSPKEYISNPHPDPLYGFSDENPSPTIVTPQHGDDPPIADQNPEPSEPSLNAEHVREAYNAMAERVGLPVARKLEGTRLRKVQTLIRTRSIDDITEAIAAIERNRWMHGDNDRGWRADFDFLLQPKSLTKLIEGSYDRA